MVLHAHSKHLHALIHYNLITFLLTIILCLPVTDDNNFIISHNLPDTCQVNYGKLKVN